MVFIDTVIHQQFYELYEEDIDGLVQFYNTFAQETEQDIVQLAYLVDLFCPESRIIVEKMEEKTLKEEENDDEQEGPKESKEKSLHKQQQSRDRMTIELPIADSMVLAATSKPAPKRPQQHQAMHRNNTPPSLDALKAIQSSSESEDDQGAFGFLDPLLCNTNKGRDQRFTNGGGALTPPVSSSPFDDSIGNSSIKARCAVSVPVEGYRMEGCPCSSLTSFSHLLTQLEWMPMPAGDPCCPATVPDLHKYHQVRRSESRLGPESSVFESSKASIYPQSYCDIDWRLVDKYSHRIKGRASQLGLASLADAACRIVVLSRSTHTPYCGTECWHALKEDVERVKEEYKASVTFLAQHLYSQFELPVESK